MGWANGPPRACGDPDYGRIRVGVIDVVWNWTYLHYVVDLWSDAWRRKKASGDVIVSGNIVLG